MMDNVLCGRRVGKEVASRTNDPKIGSSNLVTGVYTVRLLASCLLPLCYVNDTVRAVNLT